VKDRLISVIIYLLTTGLGVFAYIYPLLNTPGLAPGGTVRSNDLPLMMAVLLALCLVVLIFEIQQYRLNTKLIAILGVLIAINSVLRFIDLALPIFGGFSPLFFLILLTGYTFGGRMGFLMGSLTLFVSALITGGVGPWLPNQMITAGWVGMSAALARRFVLLTHSENQRAEIWVLLIFSALWGYLYGAITNLWFWPFLSGPGNQVFIPGSGIMGSMRNYTIYYLATSALWDTGRALGNVLMVSLFGTAMLKLLRRFQKRFQFTHTEIQEVAS
jgi:energy-coupling factor transport system substrate-specific component